jgi:hypothetical protein
MLQYKEKSISYLVYQKRPFVFVELAHMPVHTRFARGEDEEERPGELH